MKIILTPWQRYTAFQRGEAVYHDNLIQEISVDYNKEKSLLTAEAAVDGSDNNCYSCSISIDTEGNIKNFDCSCPAYYMYQGPCKHCCALGLALKDYNPANGDMNKQQMTILSTNSKFSNAIQFINQKKVESTLTGFGDMEIECHFSSPHQIRFNDCFYALDCKIGNKRKYVVNDIYALITNICWSKNFAYNKSLEFRHNLNIFTPNSQKIYRVLKDIVCEKNEEFKECGYFYSSDRYIYLSNSDLAQLLTCFENDQISTNNGPVPVYPAGNPVIDIEVTPVNQGAIITTSNFKTFIGKKEAYIFQDNAFYRCSDECFREAIDILRLIENKTNSKAKKISNELSENDFADFYSGLYPILSKHTNFKIKDIDFSQYKKLKPEVYLFIQATHKNVIRCCACVKYGSTVYDLAVQEKIQLARDIETENQILDILKKYFPIKYQDITNQDTSLFTLEEQTSAENTEEQTELPLQTILEKSKTVFLIEDEDHFYDFIQKGIKELNLLAKIYTDESLHKLTQIKKPKLSLGVQVQSDLLKMNFSIGDINIDEINKILESYQLKKKFYRLKSGELIDLSEQNDSLDILTELKDGLHLTNKDFQNGIKDLDIHHAFYLNSILKESKQAQIQQDVSFKKIIQQVDDFSKNEVVIPENLNAKLRPYQQDGFKWFSTLYHYGLGGIMADDMGLGKTLQFITLMQSEINKNPNINCLIICPMSIIYNWESEIHKFAPNLTVQTITGTAKERKLAIKNCKNFHFNITNYDTVKRDISLYEKQKFDCCLLDEAQFIKNAHTLGANAVKKIKAKHRFALTGTPIENRLSDLWSIYDFLMPTYLFSYDKFRTKFERPIARNKDKKAVEQLSKMIAPFLIRRKKADVLKDLPEKIENNSFIQMTEKQAELYEAAAKKLYITLQMQSDAEFKKNKIQVLSEMTRLRQLCCSPELYINNYKGGSGKVDACLELLQSIVENNHRVLVFSQFTTMLELIQREWKKISNEPFLYLHGATKNRQPLIDDFQNDKAKIFFISLKAGGFGLNLTNADTVIHCDPWWNEAAQNQATDRAHRIGQTKKVNVIKLVAKNTIEEKIIKLQESKADLARSIIENSDDEVTFNKLSKENLLSLFEY